MQHPPAAPPALPDSAGVWNHLLTLLRLDDADLLRKLLQTVVILALAWLAMRLLRGLARRIERAAHDHDPTRVSDAERRGRTLAGLMQSIGTAVIAITALLTILDLFVNVAPLLAGLGVVALAFSLGAQGLVKDFIGGFFILLEHQFRVGDVVRVAGVEGTVERLTLRSTTLRDGYGVSHFVANGQITVVSNLTRQWSRALVDVTVAYREDVDRVLSLLQEEVRQFADDPAWKPMVNGEPRVAGVERLSDAGVVLRLWVDVYPGMQSDAEREVRRRIKNRFDREGIEISVPRMVRVVNEPRP
jgi:moderate conductance mechanosensitive channel